MFSSPSWQRDCTKLVTKKIDFEYNIITTTGNEPSKFSTSVLYGNSQGIAKSECLLYNMIYCLKLV
jgi:hypothetical protein